MPRRSCWPFSKCGSQTPSMCWLHSFGSFPIAASSGACRTRSELRPYVSSGAVLVSVSPSFPAPSATSFATSPLTQYLGTGSIVHRRSRELRGGEGRKLAATLTPRGGDVHVHVDAVGAEDARAVVGAGSRDGERVARKRAGKRGAAHERAAG